MTTGSRLSRWGRRLGFGASIVVSVLVAAVMAWAFFSGTSGPQTNAFAAATLPQGATPTASVTPANSPTVTIKFAQASASGGTPITTYTVKRYNAQTNTFVGNISGSCAISSGTVTCTDTPGDGFWAYTDTPTFRLWVGAESPESSGVLVDTTPPTVSAPIVGATHSYVSGGTTYVANGVSLTDSASDGSGSGVASVAYYYCSGSTGSCTSSTWTAIGSSAANPFTVIWSGQPADGAYRIVAVGTDNAGNVSAPSAATVVTIDNTGPTTNSVLVGATHSYVSGGTTYVANGVGLTDSGVTDGSGSGVAQVAYYYCAGATGTCSASTPWTAIGTSTTATGNWPVTWTSQPADGAYRLVAVGTDNLGNVTSSPGTPTAVTVDNTGPLVAAPKLGTLAVSFVNGTTTFVNLEAVPLSDTSVTDAGSGVATVAYYYCPTTVSSCTSSNGTQISTAQSTSPYSVTSSSPMAAPDNAYEIVAVGADHLGNTTTSQATFVTVDTTPPSVSTPGVNGFN